ncbi:complement C1q subcomponent subunit A-like [Mantella aurantiaca]
MMSISGMILSLLLVGFLCPPSSQSEVCKANHGESGQSGRSGRPGRAGEKGERGEPGVGGQLTGLTLSKGDGGDPGAPGEPGSIGYRGPEGREGPPGESGAQGLKGVMADGRNQRRPAFSAVFSGLKDNTLLFGDIITNQENVYNGTSGLFVSPEAGYYYFTFHAVSTGDLCLHLWAKTNGNRKLLSFCDRNSRSNQPQVNSGGAVLNLNRNDRVWLETDATSRRIADKDLYSTVFSGFLLFPRGE